MLTKGYSYRIQEAQGERMFIKQEQASDITAVDQVIKKHLHPYLILIIKNIYLSDDYVKAKNSFPNYL